MRNDVNFCFWRVFTNKRHDETCNFFCFLASEVIDESVITVVVVPEDPHIPCMLFRSEKEKFYFILFYFMIR